MELDRKSLMDSCYCNSQISGNLRLCCGVWMYDVAPESSIRPIDSDYGIEMLAETGEMIARIGFDLEDDGTITIKHAPQGAHPRAVSRRARNELVRDSNFRVELVEAVINLAIVLKAPYVRGRSSENHVKVIHGSLTPQQGMDIMDNLYLSLGFKDGGDDFYYYQV